MGTFSRGNEQLHPSAWRPQFVIASHCATGPRDEHDGDSAHGQFTAAFRCWVCALVETRENSGKRRHSSLSPHLKHHDLIHATNLKVQSPRARPEKLMSSATLQIGIFISDSFLLIDSLPGITKPEGRPIPIIKNSLRVGETLILEPTPLEGAYRDLLIQ